MVILFSRQLLDKGAQFLKHLITEKKDETFIKQKLIEQLINYTRKVFKKRKRMTNPDDDFGVRYTGKIQGKNDDLAMAIQLNVYAKHIVDKKINI